MKYLERFQEGHHFRGNITMAGTANLPEGGHVHEWTETPLYVGGEGSYLLLNSNTGFKEIPHA
jgi:hypothetical protein